MSTKRPTVLILASDPAFARDISAAWPQEPAPRSAAHSGRPEFVVLDQGLSRDLEGSHYDLAIADASFGKRNIHGKDSQALHQDQYQTLRQSLVAARKPAIIIHSDRSLDFYQLHGAVLELRREPGVWPAIVGLAGREILRRIQAESRAREARALSAAAQAEATLGRYMIEMRTNINNALTTVLGNAELMMLEPGLPPTSSPKPTPSATWRCGCTKSFSVFRRSKKNSGSKKNSVAPPANRPGKPPTPPATVETGTG